MKLYDKVQRQKERLKRKQFRKLYDLTIKRIRLAVSLGTLSISINPYDVDIAWDNPNLSEYIKEIKQRLYKRYGNQVYLSYERGNYIKCIIQGGK